jgi:hypothetical protein
MVVTGYCHQSKHAYSSGPRQRQRTHQAVTSCGYVAHQAGVDSRVEDLIRCWQLHVKAGLACRDEQQRTCFSFTQKACVSQPNQDSLTATASKHSQLSCWTFKNECRSHDESDLPVMSCMVPRARLASTRLCWPPSTTVLVS